jgi:hypothetical protein
MQTYIHTRAYFNTNTLLNTQTDTDTLNGIETYIKQNAKIMCMILRLFKNIDYLLDINIDISALPYEYRDCNNKNHTSA